MLWAVLAILYLRARQKSAGDPAKRARALCVAKAVGILGLVTGLEAANSGWKFTTARVPELRAILRTSNYRDGHWYLLHLATANCSIGDCRDYRSIGGVYGPGSLQIVLNERTGDGYFDYDEFSPYDGWRQFVNHAGEI